MSKKLLFLLGGLLFLSSCKDETIIKKEEKTRTRKENLKADFSYKMLDKSAPATVEFYNKSSNADEYVWSFGDDSNKSYVKSPTHTYNKSGTYTVKLTVIGKQTRAYISKTIYISKAVPKPIPNFKFDFIGLSKQYAPSLVQFLNKSSNATEYIWDFGDGNTSNDTYLTSHTYEKGGIYTVKLTAIGAGGRETISKKIEVFDKPTKIQINSIKVTKLLNSNWDNFDGPDVYWILKNKFTNKTIIGKVVYDVTNRDMPLIFDKENLPYMITNVEKQLYLLDFWDKDTMTADDHIGGFSFMPLTYMITYPTTIKLSNNKIKVELSVTWKE